MTAYKNYSAADDARIRAGYYADETDLSISDALGRSEKAVAARRTSMRLIRRQRNTPCTIASNAAFEPLPIIAIDHETMREWVAANRSAPDLDAVNAARRAMRLPEWRLVQRWAK